MVPPRLSSQVRKLYEELAAVSDFHPREGLL
jgi:curved DNA-binding protein